MERAGDASRDAIQKGIRFLKNKGRILEEEDFLWKIPKHAPIVRNRIEFSSYLKKLEFIHTEEIKEAIAEIVKRSFGILRREVTPAALVLLGFERITDSMLQQTDKLVDDILSSGKIIQQGEMLKVL